MLKFFKNHYMLNGYKIKINVLRWGFSRENMCSEFGTYEQNDKEEILELFNYY